MPPMRRITSRQDCITVVSSPTELDNYTNKKNSCVPHVWYCLYLASDPLLHYLIDIILPQNLAENA